MICTFKISGRHSLHDCGNLKQNLLRILEDIRVQADKCGKQFLMLYNFDCTCGIAVKMVALSPYIA